MKPLPLQVLHLNWPWEPLPLQTKHLLLPVPEPWHVEQIAATAVEIPTSIASAVMMM